MIVENVRHTCRPELASIRDKLDEMDDRHLHDKVEIARLNERHERDMAEIAKLRSALMTVIAHTFEQETADLAAEALRPSIGG